MSSSPDSQDTTWTYDKKARAWYYHRFYDFEPDLNWANPKVREEIGKIVAFWLQDSACQRLSHGRGAVRH